MPFSCIRCRSEIDPKFKACPFCGEPITDFLRRYLDTPIDGKYKILSCLGVGGMGEVYKVLHVHLNVIRVVKLMRSKIADDPGAHERFLREARLATRIHHPNVATLFDFSTLEDESRYMVWEYIEGTNLHELIHQRGPLSPRQAAKLAAQTLHGLDAIHRAGIVHRDVSPENIMIAHDDDGEHVKIIDLGIAKQWGDEGGGQTQTGMFVGKWKYCSPEHLGMLKKGERIDGRADLYSFGIVLYEMLTGVTPFQATTPHGFLLMHASERPPALREMNPTVTASPELEAIIFRAMEKNRDDRFRTARDFAQAIEPLIPSLDDKPGDPPPPRVLEVTEDLTVPVSERPIGRAGSTTDLGTVDTATAPTVGAGLDARPTFVESAPPLETGQLEPAPPTLVTAELAPTLVKAQPAPNPLMTELDTAGRPGTLTGELPMRRSMLLWGSVAAAVVIALLAGVLLFQRPRAAKVSMPTAGESKAVARAGGHLGVNAFPWGEVKSIRNLTNGKTVELKEPLVTPAPIELDPGRYEITFSNPAFQNPIVRTVELRPGEEQMVMVQFADPAKATLPRFAGAKR
jgi:serine/threonine protein kinase